MKRTHIAAAVGASLWLWSASATLAAPASPFTLHLREGVRLSTVSPTKIDATHYHYTPDLTEIPSIDIGIEAGNIARIERRITTYAAVGEEGPWLRIPGIEKTSSWQSLSFKPNKSGVEVALPSAQNTELAQPEATPKEIITAFKKSPELQATDDPSRWLKLAKRCTSPTSVPCYIYPGEDVIRVTKRDGSNLTLTILYPGGC